MMHVTNVSKSAHVVEPIRVTVAEPVSDDRAVVDIALLVARETRSSLFGTRVERYPDEGVAVVTLYRD